MTDPQEPPGLGSADATGDTSSEGDDHFSDASEGKQIEGLPASSTPAKSEEDDDAANPTSTAHEVDDQPNVIAPDSAPSMDTFTIQDDEGAEDDFDEFEEGADDDDFGTFDPGAVPGDDEAAWDQAAVSTDTAAQHSLPLFDFNGLDSASEISAASQPYLRHLFPSAFQDNTSDEAELAPVGRSFLTERSESLWSQLVAPPPLQPPNWIRCRIRRLFLVSLGVPVDLDEILPASKQKKLVLPSIEIDGEAGQTAAAKTAARSNGGVDNLRQDNPSAASLGSTPSKAERKRRGPAPPPTLDLNKARLLCSTTEAALGNLTLPELKQHVSKLEDLKQRAGKVLEYWLIQRDSAKGDKEAFEEVIENLVKHAKKIRK